MRVDVPYCHADMRHKPRLPNVSAKQPLLVHSKKDRENTWMSVSTLPDLFAALATAPPLYQLVVGNTSSGIYPMPVPTLSINIAPVASLYGLTISGQVRSCVCLLMLFLLFFFLFQSFVVGANQTLSSFLTFVEANMGSLPAQFARVAVFMRRIASFTIRNVGSIAGNLMMANLQNFASDWLTLLCALNATVQVASSVNNVVSVNATDFGTTDMTKKVVVSVTIPLVAPSVFFVEKIALRSRFAHALVNMGANLSLSGTTVTAASLVVGGATGGRAVVLSKTIASLVGKDLSVSDNFVASMAVLSAELGSIIPSSLQESAFRKRAAINLFYKLVLSIQTSLPANLQSAITPFKRAPSTGHQTFQVVWKQCGKRFFFWLIFFFLCGGRILVIRLRIPSLIPFQSSWNSSKQLDR